jgi:hypothetical protein
MGKEIAGGEQNGCDAAITPVVGGALNLEKGRRLTPAALGD